MHRLQRVVIRNKSNILTFNSSVPWPANQFKPLTVKMISITVPEPESNAMILARKGEESLG